MREFAAAVALAMLVASGPAAALSIRFAARDLPDAEPGRNLYAYEYELSEFPHAAGFGISLFFAPGIYTDLASPDAGSQWDAIVLQPDARLPHAGLYDALALVPAPAQLGGFRVSFVWLGAGAPGPQPFTVYDADFTAVETGQTTPIPEPGAFGLLLGGVAALASASRARRRAHA